MTDTGQDCRFFVSYTGVKLPLRLVTAIAPEQLSNRNTFIRGYFDAAGEIELTHRYRYHANGLLSRAEIVMLEEDPVTLNFDEAGAPVAGQDAA